MASSAAQLVQRARKRANLTQVGLAERLGTTQAAVARLERPNANPTVETLDDVLRATGHRLELRARKYKPGVDETLIARHLRMTPAERLARHESAYRNVKDLVDRARLRHERMG